jgi:hypothetical protein
VAVAGLGLGSGDFQRNFQRNFRREPVGGPVVVWCDARVAQAGFYQRHGFEQVGSPFRRNGRDFVRMEATVVDRGATDPSTGQPTTPAAESGGAEVEEVDEGAWLGHRRAAWGVVVGQTLVPVMEKRAVERWLETINGRVGRGSEFRAAVALM